MRLIDADKLPIYNTIEGIEKSEKGTVAIIGSWVSTISIEEAPTIEAVPIEWIKRWNGEMPYSENIIFVKSLDVRQLLEDWEKENAVL